MVYMRLIFDLHRMLTSHDIKMMKVIMKGRRYGGFGDGELEDMHDFIDISAALVRRGLVGEGKYRVLHDMLRYVGHEEAAEVLIRAIPYPILDVIFDVNRLRHLINRYSELLSETSHIIHDGGDTSNYALCKQNVVSDGKHLSKAIDDVVWSKVEIPKEQRLCLIQTKSQVKTLNKALTADLDEHIFRKGSTYNRLLVSHINQTLQKVEELKQVTSKIHLRSPDMTGRFPKEWLQSFYETCKKILKRPKRNFRRALKSFRVALHRFVSNVNTENYVKLRQELLDECKKVIDAIVEQLVSSDRTAAPNQKEMLRDMKTCVDELVKALQMDNKLLVKDSNYVSEIEGKLKQTLQQVERVSTCFNGPSDISNNIRSGKRSQTQQHTSEKSKARKTSHRQRMYLPNNKCNCNC